MPAVGLHFVSTSVVKVLLSVDALRSLCAEALGDVCSPGEVTGGLGGPGVAVPVLSCLQPTRCLIPQPAGRQRALAVASSSKLTLRYEDVWALIQLHVPPAFNIKYELLSAD